ncbi:phosphoribosylanthranilate isomerase [bacterium]|nr:phosphoribosylanthranilate isomerase [bacterium]
MNKVKICGITNSEDAHSAAELGADFLGFNFYKKSLRRVLPQTVKEITKGLPLSLIKVGVFVNEQIEIILEITKNCGLSVVQLHGDESPEYCMNLMQRKQDLKIIKAFRIKEKFHLEELLNFKVDYYLLDSFVSGQYGGTGKIFNWEWAVKVKETGKPLFLSGGLTLENVKEALIKVNPDVLDVASGIEISPGRKDYKKMKKFIEIVKSTDFNRN